MLTLRLWWMNYIAKKARIKFFHNRFIIFLCANDLFADTFYLCIQIRESNR